jgi:selenium-binding protein 1
MVTSEWGLPPQFENGLVPDDLLSNKYGHRVHFWDLRARRNVQTIDLGANHQMALEVRPAHDPIREYGFLGVVVDSMNLEGSIWTWWREGGKFHIEKTATVPPEPASKDKLPPLLQGFGAVPPLVTDIDLSMDDRFLYVACWGTGEMRQYDVANPRKPKLAGSVHVGGIARRTSHPNGKAYAGGIAAGGFLAWLVYRYLGLKFVSRSWFNLDATWAFSLILVGALSLAISLASRH